MHMKKLLKDRVALIKDDGRRFVEISASVQPDLIITSDPKLPIEEGDYFERTLPSGLVETFIVLERGYQEGLDSIPSHYLSKVEKKNKLVPLPEVQKMSPQLFISHSSQDNALVTSLVNLIRFGLNLSATAIRCTSVDGYRLEGGANTDQQLRTEVHNAKAFLGVISAASLKSMYVVFELGARWGADKHLLPLLAPGMNSSLLSGPLTGINSLRCDNAAQLQQLIGDLGKILEIAPEPPQSFQVYIENISKMTRENDITPSTLGNLEEEELEDFKLRLQSATLDDAHDVFLTGEDLLIAIIGKERYDSMYNQNLCFIKEAAEARKATYKGTAEEAEQKKTIAQGILDSLKNRVSGIRVRA
jgi:hypothetical protein